MKFGISISRAIALFGIVTAISLGTIIFTGVYALSELIVGGPLYDKIKLGNDLVADILPPPEYVIEAYLEATLALRDPAELSMHRDRLVQLKKEYDERHDYWLKSDLDSTIKSKLTLESHREVERFWVAVNDVLLPALAKADMASAEKSYKDVSAAYAAHRTLIDDIVKRTNDGQCRNRDRCRQSREAIYPDSLGGLRFGFLHRGRWHHRRCDWSHSSDRKDDPRDETTCRWRDERRCARFDPRRRGGGHGESGSGIQGKRASRRGHENRTDRAGQQNRNRAACRHAADCRRLRESDRKSRSDSVVGIDRD